MSMKLTQKILEDHLGKHEDDPHLNLLYQILLELRSLNQNLEKLDKLDDLEEAIKNIRIVNQQVAQSSEQIINSNTDEYEAKPFIPTIEAKEGTSKGTSAAQKQTKKKDISVNIKGLKNLQSGDENAS